MLWLFLILLAMLVEHFKIDRSPFSMGGRNRGNSVISSPSSMLYKKAVIVLVNVIVSFAVNGLYVYMMVTQALVIQVIASIGLVLFKLAWLYLVTVPWLKLVDSKFLLILMVMVSNVIIIPMLDDDLSCLKYADRESSVSIAPPIIYNNQCFAAVLTNCK